MNARNLYFAIVKDLKRWARDPVGILLWAFIPLVIAFVMKLAFGGDEVAVQAKLVIVDPQPSFVTGLVKGSFSQGPLADLFEVTEADSADAVASVRAGRVSSALFLPRGFADDYLRGKRPQLRLLQNPAEQILPRISEETMEVLIDGATAVRTVLGGPIEQVVDLTQAVSPPSDSTLFDVTSRFRGPAETIGAHLFPPSIEVVDRKVGEGGSDVGREDGDPGVGFMALFFPGVLIMSLLFVGQAVAGDLWEEERIGTFRRSQTLPGGANYLVLAKLIAGAILLFVIFFALLVVGRYLLQIELQSLHLAAAFLALTGFAFLAGLSWLAVIAKSQNGGAVLSNLFIMPMILLGGGLFPLESMTGLLRTIGTHSPTGLILQDVKGILYGRPDWGSASVSVAVCLVIGLVLSFFIARQARRRFLGEA